jgi:hypothetical protein
MMLMGLFLTVVVLSSFSFLIWKKTALLNRRFFWPSLALKLFAGVSLGLVYKYYYSANDTFLFFNDSLLLDSYARSDFGGYLKFLFTSEKPTFILKKIVTVEPRSLFFVKILSVVNLFTFNNYWFSSLWFSFFSFAGSWFLFVRLCDVRKDFLWPAAVAFLLLPSCLFWGSGIIKESIALGSLFFITGFFLLLYQKRKIKIIGWISTIICTYILWSLKYYWAVLLFPALITYAATKFFLTPILKPKVLWQEITIWTLFFLALCLAATFIHPNFYLERILGVIVDNYTTFINVSEPGDVIHFDELSPNLLSILMNSPWALFSGLFRPFIFESNSLFQFISAIENFFLIILFIASLKNVRLIATSPYRLLVYSTIVYVVLLCIFLALSTPNFGTLSRYRVGFLPFFTFLVLYRNPLLSRFSFFKID